MSIEENLRVGARAKRERGSIKKVSEQPSAFHYLNNSDLGDFLRAQVRDLLKKIVREVNGVLPEYADHRGDGLLRRATA